MFHGGVEVAVVGRRGDALLRQLLAARILSPLLFQPPLTLALLRLLPLLLQSSLLRLLGSLHARRLFGLCLLAPVLLLLCLKLSPQFVCRVR